MPRISLTPTQTATLKQIVGDVITATGVDPVDAVVMAILATSTELMNMLNPRITAAIAAKQAQLDGVDAAATASKTALQTDIANLTDLALLI